MKTLSRFFAIVAVAMIGLVACKKDNGGSKPTVTLEQKAIAYNSVTFTLTPSNAQKVAYVLVNEGEEVPSAKQILESGKQGIADRAMDYIEKELEAQKSYKIAAAAMSGNNYSDVAVLDFTTVERTGFYINVEISNITDRSVDIKATPTEEQTYVLVYYPRNMFPAEMSTAEIANEYIKVQKQYLDQNMGLARGVTDHKGLRCAYGTEYMVLYFGYTAGGVGITCPAEIKLFTTEKAKIEPSALTFEVSNPVIKARSAQFDVKTNCDVIHYFAGIVEKSKYSKDAIIKEIETLIQKAYESQQAVGLASVIELLEAANFNGLPAYKGSQQLNQVGLKDKTEYILVCFAINLEGKAASEVFEYPFTTKEETFSKAEFKPKSAGTENESDYMRLFKGDDINTYFGEKYPSLIFKPTLLVAPEYNSEADTEELYYLIANNDCSEIKYIMVPKDPNDPESELVPSDEIDPTTTDSYLIDFYMQAGQGPDRPYGAWSKYTPSKSTTGETDILIIPEVSFNGWVGMPELHLGETLLMWAKDKDGVPGRMYRKLITMTYDTAQGDLIGNATDLESFLFNLGYSPAEAARYMSIYYDEK